MNMYKSIIFFMVCSLNFSLFCSLPSPLKFSSYGALSRNESPEGVEYGILSPCNQDQEHLIPSWCVVINSYENQQAVVITSRDSAFNTYRPCVTYDPRTPLSNAYTKSLEREKAQQDALERKNRTCLQSFVRLFTCCK